MIRTQDEIRAERAPLAIVPVIETAPETALSVSVADQGAETHTRVGVSDSSGAEARSGGPSSLADMIIEAGPFTPGQYVGGLRADLNRSAALNELRDELIRLRAIAAKAETLLRAADVTGTDQSPKEA